MIKKLIDLLIRIKTSDKPLMIHVKNKNLLFEESLYYKKIFGDNIHGVIISDVKAGYIKFFVMTSQFKFNLPSGNSRLIMYGYLVNIIYEINCRSK
jgi:hypothetical protein